MRPTAVLCSNDMTAIGVMRESHECGITIPRDLSVVGFDDIRLAQFVIPRLPACECRRRNWPVWPSMPSRGVGAGDPAPNGTEYVLKTHLVLRESTSLISQVPKPAGK